MAPAPTPQMPGNLTVPVLFGWENLATVVVLVVVTAVVFVVILAAASTGSGRSEWQAWLDARSSRSTTADPADTDRRRYRGSHSGSQPA